MEPKRQKAAAGEPRATCGVVIGLVRCGLITHAAPPTTRRGPCLTPGLIVSVSRTGKAGIQPANLL